MGQERLFGAMTSLLLDAALLVGASATRAACGLKSAGNRMLSGNHYAPLISRTATGILMALAIAGASAAAGGAARAQVLVDGRPDAVHVEARNVPLREVLAALQAKFNLRFRANDALNTRKSGVFDGRLQRVAASLLDGHDFVMTITPQSIDILVLWQSLDRPVAAMRRSPGAARLPAPVMTAQEANRYERGQAR
jgi:hypothetical protein